MLHVPLLADPSAEVPEWWADSDQGGGWLGAHGSQVIDQIRVTLGEFESVCASLPHVADAGHDGRGRLRRPLPDGVGRGGDPAEHVG